jgi:hypothetical protein
MVKPIPSHIATINIVENEFLGCVAHGAVCTVKGCGWKSALLDVRADGEMNASVMRWAEAHAATHTDAQDALDQSQEV